MVKTHAKSDSKLCGKQWSDALPDVRCQLEPNHVCIDATTGQRVASPHYYKGPVFSVLWSTVLTWQEATKEYLAKSQK